MLIKRFLDGRLDHRRLALINFSVIMVIGMATGLMLALVLLKFLSTTFLVEMGDLCGGIFAASHDFLAASRWNYLLVTLSGTVFLLQAVFLLFGGARLFRTTHKMKQASLTAGMNCPALATLAPEYGRRDLVVLCSDTVAAQTIGLFRPRVVLSTALAELLSGEELQAVIAHEEAHRAGRDNLLRAAARSVTLAFFYLPGLKHAYMEMSTSLELAADKQAVDSGCSQISVARTLMKVAAVCVPADHRLAIASAVNGGDDLEKRLLSLAGSYDRHPDARRRLALFALVTLTFFTGFAGSAFAVVKADQADALICYTEHELVDNNSDCDISEPHQQR